MKKSIAILSAAFFLSAGVFAQSRVTSLASGDIIEVKDAGGFTKKTVTVGNFGNVTGNIANTITGTGSLTVTGGLTIVANTAITGTLGVSGLFSPAASINNSNGTVSLPAYGFTSDTDCGIYRIGANNLGVAANGAKVLDIATTGLGVTGLFTASTSIQAGTTVITDAITEKTAGVGIELSKQTIQLRTATTYTATGAITVTAAELNGGLLVAATSTATTTFTLPTATEAATQLGATAGATFDFVLLNTGASNGTVTVAVGAGMTASDFPGTNTLTRTGSATVGAAVFRLTFLSTTAAILTRIS